MSERTDDCTCTMEGRPGDRYIQRDLKCPIHGPDILRPHLVEEQTMADVFPKKDFNPLTFARLRNVSGARANDCAQAIDARTPEWWSNAMAGETGEVCNLTKKLSRLTTGDGAWNIKPGDQDIEALTERIAEECADVVIYADLLMQRMGRDLGGYVRKVFNKKSEEINSKHRL